MVASYDTDLHSVSLLSLPRDLLVITHDDQIGRINSVMSHAYNTNGGDIRSAALTLSKKVEKITGLTIPYYAMIDFDGFIQIVDSLGGIDINVPSPFIDMQYPVDWNGEYEIFELPEGMNKLSGPNTLKYARSRHSTSDFSRSKRQQSIIKAIMTKIMSSENFSISKLKELYTNYTSIVKTNISLDNMIGLLQYDTAMPTIHSFGYTMQCSNDIRKTMIP
jgi:LCP family protein required for cell wall assembly